MDKLKFEDQSGTAEVMVDQCWLHKLCRKLASENSHAHGRMDSKEMLETAADSIYENMNEDTVIDVLMEAFADVEESKIKATDFELIRSIDRLALMQKKINRTKKEYGVDFDIVVRLVRDYFLSDTDQFEILCNGNIYSNFICFDEAYSVISAILDGISMAFNVVLSDFLNAASMPKIEEGATGVVSKDPYKVDIIEKHISAMRTDEYYLAQLCGPAGKNINLDEGALQLLKKYYAGENTRHSATYTMLITYSFDIDYVSVPCSTEAEARMWLEKYLNEEIGTIERESGYKARVIRFSSTEIVLVYGDGNDTVGPDDYYEHDYAMYKIVEIEHGHHAEYWGGNVYEK